MKLFLFLLLLAGAYLYGLLRVTNTVMGQVQHLNATYQYVANNANNIAAGAPIPRRFLGP